jgi:hypothetical protein
MATLNAPAVVVVPATSSLAAPVRVDYGSGVDLAIRERVNGGGWRTRQIPQNQQSDLRNGRYVVSVTPGQKYEAEAYRRDSLPPGFPANVAGVDRLAVVASRAILASGSTRFPLTEPFNPEVGGTYWWARVATPPLSTFVLVQVGLEPPTRDGDGFLRMPTTISHMEFNEATVHSIEVEPLIPGTQYHYVVTILDVGSAASTGRWEQQSGSFTTKQRTTFINFKQLVVTDDSDPNSSAGPGRFAFQIRETGRNQSSRVERDFQFTIKSFTDKAPKNIIDLSPYGLAHIVSPKPLTPETEHLGISLRGVEEDASAFFDPDDIAETPYGTAVRLELPTGRFKESFAGRQQTVHAQPRTSADLLRFHVHIEYAAFYS